MTGVEKNMGKFDRMDNNCLSVQSDSRARPMLPEQNKQARGSRSPHAKLLRRLQCETPVSVEFLNFFAAESRAVETNFTVVNDSVHGHIELHPLLVKIIDTPQFQRLRNIKQLGAGYWVFPGASHNRFEHSIGVAHLAGCLVKSLQEKQPELHINNRDVLCVQIAGLCHDLGHGPFSHLFDLQFLPEVRPDLKWKHEKGSVDMLEFLIKENGLQPQMKDYGLNEIIQNNPNENDLSFIKELIKGVDTSKREWSMKGRTEDKAFLYEIVANERNKIDVDKWDYFARDCHHLGISKSFDHQRLLKFARVCKVEIKDETKDGKTRLSICYRDKSLQHSHLEPDGFDLDSKQFCPQFPWRIKEALVSANDHFQISEAVHDMGEYTKLTGADKLKKAAEELQKGAEKLEKAEEELQKGAEKLEKDKKTAQKMLQAVQEILQPEDLQDAREKVMKILKRDLPKCLGEVKLKKSLEVKDDWKKAVEKKTDLKAEDFVVDVVQIDHGMKDKNPMHSVYFYSKRDPNTVFLKNDQMFQPKDFYEQLFRVYYKGPEEKLKDAQQFFEEWKLKIDPKAMV
ncbi:deoxynucleoside triphosphate triphosphohydrolase SAMHD1-like [Pseudorasbora parva]|uniref:deoxynucleoside triphosphate triphosphohydrolase SAMHD1-like n=1 Tax=Pseudorasbora parva TaxID=51549 RepID=UPI00351E87F8